MKRKSVRTTVDLPFDLHRGLCETAARQGCTIGYLITEAIERMLPAPQRPKTGRLILKRPLLAGKRKPIAITGEQIYELGFP